MGIKEYLMYDGFSYRFIPFKNKVSSLNPGKMDALGMYRKMKEVFTWQALSRTDYFADYQNMYTFLGVLNQRQMFLTVANALIDIEEDEKAIEMLELCEKCVPVEQFPLETIPAGFTGNDYVIMQIIETYLFLGKKEKALELTTQLSDALLETANFYAGFLALGRPELEASSRALFYLEDVLEEYGEKETADKINDALTAIYKQYTE